MPDSDLVALLESLVTAERLAICGIAQQLYPDAGLTCERLGDGVAQFGGKAIGVSTVCGVWGHRPLAAAELAAADRFLRRVGDGPVEFAVHGDVHPELADQLRLLGLHAEETEDVLALRLDPSTTIPSAAPGHVVCIAGPERVEEWIVLVATAFNDGEPPPEPDLRFARCIARRPGVVTYWAHVDGCPAAAGELWIGQGVGWLSADATLPRYRSLGLHRALQVARLNAARDAGCDLAVTEAAPGTSSHRNALRTGFRPRYSRTIYSRGRS